jgi:predicted RNA-binding protein with PUA-like domain
MAYWLFKQEPSSYSYPQLETEGQTVWDGVSNNLALKHLRNVKAGDRIFFYHTGEEKRIVGIMEASGAAYQNSKGETVVDVRPVARLPKPVSLETIKSDRSFSSWELVRISRLSVMPVPPELWKKIQKLGSL